MGWTVGGTRVKFITEPQREILSNMEGVMTIMEVVGKMGWRYSSVQNHLASLARKKAVIKLAKGTYQKVNQNLLTELLEKDHAKGERKPKEKNETPDTLVYDMTNITQELKDSIWDMREMPRSMIANKLDLTRLTISLILDFRAEEERRKKLEENLVYGVQRKRSRKSRKRPRKLSSV
jgi:hypothetical protein